MLKPWERIAYRIIGYGIIISCALAMCRKHSAKENAEANAARNTAHFFTQPIAR